MLENVFRRSNIYAYKVFQKRFLNFKMTSLRNSETQKDETNDTLGTYISNLLCFTLQKWFKNWTSEGAADTQKYLLNSSWKYAFETEFKSCNMGFRYEHFSKQQHHAIEGKISKQVVVMSILKLTHIPHR